MIRFHRKKAGLSRVELARLVGVGKTLLYELEHGRLTVRFETLLAICSALNIGVHFTSRYMDEWERM